MTKNLRNFNLLILGLGKVPQKKSQKEGKSSLEHVALVNAESGET